MHAFPDDVTKMTITDRRDSFCGKMSACNNLTQYGIKFSLTTLHTVDPESESFKADLRRFAAICRVVRGLRGARLGAIGARPAAFNTVRYSEKLLERAGISVDTLDLSEVFGKAARLKADDPRLKAKLDEMKAYVPAGGVPGESLTRMAKLGVVIDDWMEENNLDATRDPVLDLDGRVLRRGSLHADVDDEQQAGPLRLRDRHRRRGRHVCHGARLRQALRASSTGTTTTATTPTKASSSTAPTCPRTFSSSQSVSVEDVPKMDYQAIIAGTVGKENTYGTIVGRLKAVPFTYCRVSTDDLNGAHPRLPGRRRPDR